MTEISRLQKQVVAFRDERNWKKFHNQKDVALSLALEAAEVLEHFQWKTTKLGIDQYVKSHREEIGEELADVLYWVLLMSHDMGIDLETVFKSKMAKNAKKYPVSKSRGRPTKYTQL